MTTTDVLVTTGDEVVVAAVAGATSTSPESVAPLGRVDLGLPAGTVHQDVVTGGEVPRRAIYVETGANGGFAELTRDGDDLEVTRTFDLPSGHATFRDGVAWVTGRTGVLRYRLPLTGTDG